jgi:hypothetical protein
VGYRWKVQVKAAERIRTQAEERLLESSENIALQKQLTRAMAALVA